MLPAVLIPEAANAIDDVAIMLEDGAGNEPANPSRCKRLAKNLLLGTKILLWALPVLLLVLQAVQTPGTPGVTDVEVLVKEIERRGQQILDLKEGHVKEIEHLEQQILNLEDESWADTRRCADEMAMEKRKSLITQHQVSGIQVQQLFFI
jgi:hypothetical protein